MVHQYTVSAEGVQAYAEKGVARVALEGAELRAGTVANVDLSALAASESRIIWISKSGANSLFIARADHPDRPWKRAPQIHQLRKTTKRVELSFAGKRSGHVNFQVDQYAGSDVL